MGLEDLRLAGLTEDFAAAEADRVLQLMGLRLVL